MTRARNWWGWGHQDQALGDDEVRGLADMFTAVFHREVEVRPAPALADDMMAPPTIDVPSALQAIARTDVEDRARHAYGRAYRDVVRGFHGVFDHPPDAVLRPRDEADVAASLDWAGDAGVKVVPYGGGSSVVGGVEARPDDAPDGWVSLDMTSMSRVLDVDPVSRAARIEGGALGPVLEAQLRPHGLTLRHFPQSFEFSTLGGWIATRSGGHYATVYTHIDDLVESMRIVTPRGVSESRRLPGSGAGPSPDRVFLGSEGGLGVITEAWMRVQDRVRWKASAGVEFTEWGDAVAATRAVSQSALFPTNCRLLDRGEAALNAGRDVAGLLVLGFESADHPTTPSMERALELCADHRGVVPDGPVVADAHADDADRGSRTGAVGAWRNSFLRAPYLRDGLVRCGILAETFETACTWDRFDEVHASVTAAVSGALDRICGGGTVTCRFTHVYPDGPAPYFSVIAPTTFGSEVTIWDEVKAAASEALMAAGATITHHHSVGRDHDEWYRRQRPEVVGAALRSVKAELDPAGVLNPGVIY